MTETGILKEAISSSDANTSIMVSVDNTNEFKKDFDDYSNKEINMFMKAWEESFSNEGAINISTARTKIDDRTFIKIKGEKFDDLHIAYFGFYDNKLYTIGTTQNVNNAKNNDTYKEIIKSVNTFRFGPRESYTSYLDQEENKVNYFSTDNLMLLIIFGAALTYGIGIGIPYLLKKFVIKKSINKKKAIILSIAWYVIQILFFSLIGSNNTSVGPMISSFITYNILLKDNNEEFQEKQDQEQEESVNEKVEDNKNIKEDTKSKNKTKNAKSKSVFYFLVIYLLLSFLYNMKHVIDGYNVLFNGKNIQHYDSGFKFLLNYEFYGNVIMVVIILFLINSLVEKKKHFPKLLIYSIILKTIYNILYRIFRYLIPFFKVDIRIGLILLELLFSSLMIYYILKSKRINKMFENG
jgi:hypothetical protein